MNSDVPNPKKEPARLSPLSGAAILAACFVGLWLASLILRHPEATLERMKSGLWLFVPVVATGAAICLTARKKKKLQGSADEERA